MSVIEEEKQTPPQGDISCLKVGVSERAGK